MLASIMAGVACGWVITLWVKQYPVTYLAQIRDHSGVRFGRELILERTQNVVC